MFFIIKTRSPMMLESLNAQRRLLAWLNSFESRDHTQETSRSVIAQRCEFSRTTNNRWVERRQKQIRNNDFIYFDNLFPGWPWCAFPKNSQMLLPIEVSVWQIIILLRSKLWPLNDPHSIGATDKSKLLESILSNSAKEYIRKNQNTKKKYQKEQNTTGLNEVHLETTWPFPFCDN